MRPLRVECSSNSGSLKVLEKSWEQTLLDKVSVEAFDGDEIILSVESLTTPNLKYMIVASFQSGTARCDCMDARCRSKIIDFTDGTGFYCKHLKLASVILKPFYEAALKGILKVNK